MDPLIERALDMLAPEPGDHVPVIIEKAEAASEMRIRLETPREEWRGTRLTAAMAVYEGHTSIFYAPHHSVLYEHHGIYHEVGHLLTDTMCRRISIDEMKHYAIPLEGVIAAYARKITSSRELRPVDFEPLRQRLTLDRHIAGDGIEESEELVESFAYGLAARVRGRRMDAFGEVFA